MDGTRSVTSWRAGVLASVLLGIVYVALPSLPAEVLFQLVAWGSVAVFMWNVLRRRLGAPWVLIGIGWASFAIGDLLFDVYDLVLHVGPFPSPADVFYVAGYPFLAVGLASLVRRCRPDGDRIALIDAGIVAVPAAVLAWLYLIEPNALASSASVVERVVSAAYPVGDLLCLAVVLRLVVGPVISRRACRPALTPLMIGMATMLAADTWFAASQLSGGYTPGGWNDAMYLAPYLMLAAASMQPSIARIGDPLPSSDPSLGGRRLAMLAVAALVTPVILGIRWIGHSDLAVPLMVLGTAASFLLVVARMSGIVDALEVSRAQLAHDATHDSLTGLPNRTLLTQRLDDVLADGEPGALLFVDLDRFKQINDRFGHQAGDEVLIMAAGRMQLALRDTDHLARFAGDEFAVILPGVSQTKAFFVAERMLQQLRFEVSWSGGAAVVSASIGMATWDRDGHGRSSTQLLNEADRAMYLAKSGSGDQLATTSALISH